MKFSEQDIKQLESKGLSLKTVESQIELFKSGIPFTNIVQAATIDDGIMPLNEAKIEEFIAYFEDRKNDLALVKFVPASGAATRMFKFLFQFLMDFNPEEESIKDYIESNKSDLLSVFVSKLEQFPFYNSVLVQIERNGIDFYNLSTTQKVWHFVQTMLKEDELNYGNYPKGLLPFHKYSDSHIATAFEEHLYEAALYANGKNKAKLHFTISVGLKDRFEAEFNRIATVVTQNTGVKFDAEYSYQAESTDTIAVTPNNKPFRNHDGSILYRPSGHGALLKNLNSIDADVVFIKNIDNVVVADYRDVIAKYKKGLAGLLLQLQTEAFTYLEELDKEHVSNDTIITITDFVERRLNAKLKTEFHTCSDEEKRVYLHNQLNRPIRVCGMVKNEGEPGGGPFWIADEAGNESLQIVESAQINLKDQSQKSILENATHFNPVDIVCSIKNYKGEKFNLDKFVNDKAAFITMKTKVGKDLKALELPGLWNGSMAFWNTIFVEVPITTFNPVKTVNDLLKAPHQFK
ncbi:DUF4301 family protein [Winogradskyella sp. DF17]|uniref:DUF4301 family protein n=1 Tax=Winogradskyella pelagia TaxID=2819984 RepID=A0ABS3T5Z4_9FLAO|nr:DUF4301 family protein [Winogradskyella sp. DF17]MBO3117874.1 DUF4301 family protein [Winogradskyella sp. DF17]